ncbi:MAG: NAD(P)/FAD-dependent oxidoreductase [bacterium]|nr:NAD(P)/FAD-dependent oxidoreductase [bacterium]
MEKKVVIIGAGIAGLTAGCYARMNGFDAEIYESHSIAGGLCTSWKRGDYIFDGCIHFLAGTSSEDGGGFYKYWNEVGALKNVEIIDHEVYARYTYDDCEVVYYCNPDRLEKHLIELSPADEKAVKKMCKLIRKFSGFTFNLDKPFEMMNIFDIFRMMLKLVPYMKVMKWGSNISVGDFADTFKHPRIRSSLKKVFPSELPLLALIMTFSMFYDKFGGYPIGGSLEFARGIEKNYINMGGKIFFNKTVESIKINEKKADGIELSDGSFVRADYIISASDLEKTLNKLMGNRLKDSPFEKLFENDLFPNPTGIQISLGINSDFSSEPEGLNHIFPLERSLEMGNDIFEDLPVKIYSYDPTLSPEKKTSVVVLYGAGDSDYWYNLRKNNKAEYNAEKKRILDFTITELAKHYPGIENKIEEKDVVTPATYIRYTQNFKGAYVTWLETSRNSKYIRTIPNRLNEVGNVYFSGQWLMPPGGLSGALVTSRNVVQLICKNENKKFITK